MPRSVAEWLAQIEAESTDLDREAADLVAAETTARAAAALATESPTNGRNIR